MRDQRFRALPCTSSPEGEGGSWRRGSGAEESVGDRLERIREAMRRGEERQMRLAIGEVLDEEGQQPQRMTPNEEQLLQQLFVQPGEVQDTESELVVGAETSDGRTLMQDAAEVRILKTLEFCPDGVLAKEILQELSFSGQPPGAGAYDAVLEAFSQRGALDDALAVFQEMQSARVPPTDLTYDALARPAARGGDYRFVETLYTAKASDRGGAIGAGSLALLLDAYANGLPRQAGRAEAAFRGAMASAEERYEESATVASGRVLTALRRAVGSQNFEELCKEYGLDPEALLVP